MNAETIWEALKERLDAKTGGKFTTITRAPRDVWGIEQCPVLEIFEDTESPTSDDPEPLWTLSGHVGIREYLKDPNASQWTRLNELIEVVRSALERQPTDHDDYAGQPGHYTNLGGLVESLSLGRITKGFGESTSDARATLDLELTAY